MARLSSELPARVRHGIETLEEWAVGAVAQITALEERIGELEEQLENVGKEDYAKGS